MMKPLIISFSGGRTSAYMAYLLTNAYKGKREIYTVFANTGKEREETLEFVQECDKAFGLNVVWIEGVQHHGKRKSPAPRVVDFTSAARKGEPFIDMIKKHGIPNAKFPHCTRELKTYPINNYVRSLGLTDWDMAIGIRADESSRAVRKPRYVYPLIKDFPTTKHTVSAFWAKQSFILRLKGYEGNCDMCWKKSKRKLLTLLIERPELAGWWNSIEVQYGQYVPPTQVDCRRVPITFYRGNESMEELLDEAQFPFEPAIDEYLPLISSAGYSEDLDSTDGCSESCEPF